MESLRPAPLPPPLRRALAILFLAGGLAPAIATAVEIEPGRLYEGGTTLSASDVGLTTVVPQGWSALLPAGASALVMERADQQAWIFVLAERMDAAALSAQMAGPIDLGDGILLTPSGAPTREAKGLLGATYRVSGMARPARGRIWARVGESGLAVAFVAIDAAGDEGASGEDAAATARRLAEGVAFAEPDVSGEGSAAWADYLRGRYLARFYSGSNYHEKTELWLCSDGRFRRRGDGGGWGNGASGAFENAADGRWSAVGVQPAAGELRLELEDGLARHVLTLEGGKLFLDGTQWLRGDNELCD